MFRRERLDRHTPRVVPVLPRLAIEPRSRGTFGLQAVSVRHSIVRNVAWSAAEQWGRESVSLLLFVVLSRLLAPEAFGLLALASVFMVLGSEVVGLGLRWTLVQRRALEPEHLDTAFWSNVAGGVVLATIVTVSAGWIATAAGDPRLAPILQALSARFVIGSLATAPEAILMRDSKFRSLAVRTNLATAGGGFVAVGLALAGFGVWSLVVQVLLSQTIGAIGLWWATPWRPGLRISRRHAVELFRFSAPILAFNLVGRVNQQAHPLLIGTFFGAAALGYYVIGFRILDMMLELFTSVSSRVALPAFSRMQDQPARLVAALSTAVRWTSALTFPAFAGLALVAPELVLALLGERWAPSIPILRILALVGLLQSIFYFHGAMLVATGHPTARLLQLLVHAGVNVALFFLVQPWGLVAVASAYVARAYALIPFDVWLLQKAIPVRPGAYLRNIARSSFATVAMVGVLFGIKATPLAGDAATFPLLATLVVVGVVAYALTVLAWTPQLARTGLARVHAWQVRHARRAG